MTGEFVKIICEKFAILSSNVPCKDLYRPNLEKMILEFVFMRLVFIEKCSCSFLVCLKFMTVI